MKKKGECVLRFCYEIRLRMESTGRLESISMKTDSGKVLHYNRCQIMNILQQEEDKQNLKQMIKAIAFMHPGERKELYYTIQEEDPTLYLILEQIWKEIWEEI